MFIYLYLSPYILLLFISDLFKLSHSLFQLSYLYSCLAKLLSHRIRNMHLIEVAGALAVLLNYPCRHAHSR